MNMLSHVKTILKNTTKRNIYTNIVYSKSKQVNIPKITLQEYLWKNLSKHGSRTAIECLHTGKRYSYHDLRKKSLSLANFLKTSLKLQSGSTVAIVMPSMPEYPIVLLGAIEASLKATTCNPFFTSDEIRHQVVAAESKVIFTSSEFTPVVKNALKGIQERISIIEIKSAASADLSENVISFDEIADYNSNLPCSDANIKDTILLPYSSGTTGLPKGVELSHFNIVANLTQVASSSFNLIDEDEQYVVPAILPLFHIYGLTIIIFHTLAMGAKLLTLSKFSSDIFADVLQKHKPHLLLIVPALVNMIINNPKITLEDLKCVRYINSGAAPLGVNDIERFHRKTKGQVNLIQSYGMTEASPLVSMQTKHLENGVEIGGCGLLLPNTSARIISETNEVLIKGPQIMKGYFKNPKATEESFTSDGWYKTGDIARFDKNGHLFITGRLKELIKVRGFQVAPAELEEILRSHPKIEDVAVIGVPHDINGEAPKAFVVPKAGTNIKSEDLQKFVAERVVKYKQLIGGVVFVDEIPKSLSGKILRHEVRRKYVI